MAIEIKKPSHYMGLDSWILACVLQQATYQFCINFLNKTNDPCGRMFDQMTQAARSIQANIAEGSSRGQTSKETEMKLLDVARASASELASDFMFVLMLRKEAAWTKDNPNRKAVYDLRLEKAIYKGDFLHEAMAHILKQRERFAPYTESTDLSIAANSLLVLCGRVISMITKMMTSRLEQFKMQGGFTENLTKERVEAKKNQAQSQDAPACPKCGAVMLLHTAKKGMRSGSQFWGCSNYPHCDGIRNLG